MIQQNCRAPGFSLIEAAIVLGIVGLVIGGIWVAASAVNEKFQTNQTIRNILLTCTNAQRIYPARKMPASTFGTTITQTSIRSGIFPSDWSNGRYLDEWHVYVQGKLYISGTAILDGTSYPTPSPAAGTYTFSLAGMSKQRCINLFRPLAAEASRKNSVINRVWGFEYNNYPYVTMFGYGSTPTTANWSMIDGMCDYWSGGPVTDDVRGFAVICNN